MDNLVFQGTEEVLGHRIVIAVAFAAHAGNIGVGTNVLRRYEMNGFKGFVLRPVSKACLYIVTVITILAATIEAQAVPVTFDFTAEVTMDMTGYLQGQSIVGSYTFESTTPDTNPDPAAGSYEGNVSLSMSIGTYSFTGANGGIYVENDHVHTSNPLFGPVTVLGTEDSYRFAVYPIGGRLPNGLGPQVLTFQLGDDSSLALNSDALLIVPPDLSRFAFNYGSIDWGHGTTDFRVTSLTQHQTVPEPSSLLLLGLGLSLVAYWRRWGTNSEGQQ